MRTHNPVFGKSFGRLAVQEKASGVMTVNGVIDKTAILLLLVLVTATYTWNNFLNEGANVGGLMTLGIVGGLIAAIATIFRPAWAPVTAPVYALAEGLALGGISAYFNYAYPGIAVQAISLTVLVLGVMLALYRLRIIKVTAKLRSGILAATGAVFLFYLFTFIGGFFGLNTGYMYSSSPLGIGISLVVVGIAALNLLLDFDFIENASRQSLPGYMNWFAAFGLLVTLVWLYLELLRLLGRLRNN